jgi:hypothetical protein
VKFAYYVVDVEGLPASDRAEVCGVVVRTLGETAVRFETDIPWAEAADWSADVRRAAEHLVIAAGKTHADEAYQQTGIMQRADEAVWQSFATFAGYAYDASVWSNTRVLPLVSLADCGTELVVRVNDEERSRLEDAVSPVRVVRLDQVRAEQRRSR